MTFAVFWGTVFLAEGVDCEVLVLGEAIATEEGDVQWGPADVQPFVLSPNWWMCIPRSAVASWPEISQEMSVGEDSEVCSKVTVPLTLESPRRTATDCGSVRMSRNE